MKKIISFHLLMAFSPWMSAQTNSPDTVIVELANTSRITFTMQDRSDLVQLREYDYQALFDDILFQLESRDTIPGNRTDAYVMEEAEAEQEAEAENEDWDEDNDNYRYRHHRSHTGRDDDRNRFPYTRQFFNMDLGINYLHENGIVPEPNDELYAVRPWGSWNLALNSTQRTHLSRKFAFEWSFGISWYNFKFYEENLLLTRQEDEVVFEFDPRPLDFTKSKLTVSYLNASLIPMYDAGGRYKDDRYRRWQNSTFRIGAGPYVGFRLFSYTKQQYEEDGDKEVDREHDHFYLQDLRYGIRLQVGIRDVDLFFNYDLNELFKENKGPDVNAFSFGVVF